MSLYRRGDLHVNSGARQHLCAEFGALHVTRDASSLYRGGLLHVIEILVIISVQRRPSVCDRDARQNLCAEAALYR